MKRVFWFWSVALLVILGCGGGGNNTTIAPDPLVGFINASTNSVGLDAFLDDIQIGTNVPLYNASPQTAGVLNFVSIEPADHDCSVQEATNPDTQAIEVIPLARDKSYLFVASGLVTPPNTEFDKRMRPVVAEFDRTKPNGDKARLIIVNAYNRDPGFETPNIDFRGPGDNPLFNETDIAPHGTRATLIDAGTQTFVARRNGTEFEITPEVTFDFGGGKIYAAIVGGVESGTGASAPTIKFIEIQSK